MTSLSPATRAIETNDGESQTLDDGAVAPIRALSRGDFPVATHEADARAMIDLYYWTTPNGHKITMFLEETGLEYRVHPINIGKGEQFQPHFLAISPNNRIPAIVDQVPTGGGAPISIFESGAILLYLAQKTGKLWPADLRGQVETTQWLIWQVANLGPMAGQNHHFVQSAPEELPYAIDRYVRETNRLYGVLDRRLAGREYICGAQYSIADIASYPWIVPYERQQQNLADFPNVKRWFEAIRDRPATVRAYKLAEGYKRSDQTSEESRKILFGQTAEVFKRQY